MQKEMQKNIYQVNIFMKCHMANFKQLRINSDFTFKQIVYAKNKKDGLYENMGKMYMDSENRKLKDGRML